MDDKNAPKCFAAVNYCVITDKRVIHFAKGSFSGGTDSFYYRDISSAEQNTGLLLADISRMSMGRKKSMDTCKKMKSRMPSP